MSVHVVVWIVMGLELVAKVINKFLFGLNKC